MADLIQNGTVGHETQVWNEGMTAWVAAKDTELANQLKGIPPSMPNVPPPPPNGGSPVAAVLKKSVFQIVTFLLFPFVGIFFSFFDTAVLNNMDYDNLGGAMLPALILCALPLAARLFAKKLETSIPDIAKITCIYSWVIVAVAMYGVFCTVLDTKYDMSDYMVTENEEKCDR